VRCLPVSDTCSLELVTAHFQYCRLENNNWEFLSDWSVSWRYSIYFRPQCGHFFRKKKWPRLKDARTHNVLEERTLNLQTWLRRHSWHTSLSWLFTCSARLGRNPGPEKLLQIEAGLVVFIYSSGTCRHVFVPVSDIRTEIQDRKGFVAIYCT
jgi:hypothetical protein